ncbi:MAG TPA: CidA/LrgA family protein [Sulfurimonas sp.]|nr:CidA/LrgA family protein [Sulfurimonas sp.]
MLYLKQFSIILFFYLLGEGISYILPFEFPGSILGMIVLFLALSLNIVKPSDIKIVSDFFLKYMALFFIPAGVSLMSSYHLIEDYLLLISIILVISTVFMLSFISLLVDYFVKKAEDV